MSTVMTPSKIVSFTVAGSGETRDVKMSPGTTLKEALDAARLQGFQVSEGPDSPFLQQETDLYLAVADGATLYASTPAEAGRS